MDGFCIDMADFVMEVINLYLNEVETAFYSDCVLILQLGQSVLKAVPLSQRREVSIGLVVF